MKLRSALPNSANATMATTKICMEPIRRRAIGGLVVT
jgi:hypothetical protein